MRTVRTFRTFRVTAGRMEDMEAPLNAVAIEVSQKSPKDPVMKETMRMVGF